MDTLIILLFCVSMTMGFNNNESTDGTGVILYEYRIVTHCSAFVSASEVDQYERVKENATKLVYVHFEYNGTQWDVIKVLDGKSKYLLTLGDYKRNMMFSLHTLRFGTEYINVTSYKFSSGCVMDEIFPIFMSILLVSNDFKSGCEDLKCLDTIPTTGPVCIQNGCRVSCRYGELDWERLRLPDSTYFAIATILLFCKILGTVMTISRRFINFYFIGITLDSKLTMHTYVDFDGIRIVENNNYLIEKQSVPCGILSILFDIYVPHLFPSVHLWFKGKSLSWNFIIYVFFLNLLALFPVYAIAIRNQLLALELFLTASAFLLTLHVVRPGINFIDNILNNLDSILHAFKDCSFLVLIALFTLFLPLIPVYIALKLITRYKKYGGTSDGQTCRNCMKYIVALISAFVWLSICLFISLSLTLVTFLTLVGISTNLFPYAPLVLASIVNWLKISARLSNWYSCFFETVLDQVMSMIEEKAFKAMLHSERNCFLVVKSRSPMQIQGRLLQISGTPIFMDRKGNMKLTKTFFQECLKISNNRLQHNSLSISSDSVRQLICVNICLFLIALIIKSFGVVGQLPTSYLTLESLAGGVLPFIVNNIIVKDIPVSGIVADKILKCHLEHLINAYEESFVIENYSETKPIDILGEQNKRSNLVSNGCEITTVRSHISPDGHELITEPSNFMTEHIGGEGDTSERNLVLSFKTCEDLKEIDEEGQERITELQEDPNFIDIK